MSVKTTLYLTQNNFSHLSEAWSSFETLTPESDLLYLHYFNVCNGFVANDNGNILITLFVGDIIASADDLSRDYGINLTDNLYAVVYDSESFKDCVFLFGRDGSFVCSVDKKKK